MQTYIKKNKLPLSILVIISITLITFTISLLNKNEVTIQLNEIPLRSEPLKDSQNIGKLVKGNKVKVLNTKNNWSYVLYTNEKKAWLPNWLLYRKDQLVKLTPLAETTVMLDAGHGGNDTGALSNNNDYEKTYTLKAALATKTLLESYGVNVVMTRDSDKLVYLSNIPKIAQENNADVSISFHFDSAPQKNTASGLTTYYYHKNNGSYTLANTLNQEMNSLKIPNRGVDFGNFLVIRQNKKPAVLLEMGYINSNHDFKIISSINYPTEIANSVKNGLDNYFS